MNTLQSIIFAAITFAAVSTCAHADELTPQQALEKYAQSIALVKSYDVWLTGTETQFMTTRASKIDGKLHFVPAPRARTVSLREVAENNKNFRIEYFTERPDVQTVNGDVAMGFRVISSSGKVRATIEKRPDDLSSFLFGPAYGTYYGNAKADITLPNALRERKTMRHIVDATKPGMYIIEFPPETAVKSEADAGWRLTLDPANGYLPACLESYIDDMRKLALRTEILESKSLPVGVAVPTKVKCTGFANIEGEDHFGQPICVYEVSVDLTKSRWNSELDPEIFKVQFPPGTEVVDKTAQ